MKILLLLTLCINLFSKDYSLEFKQLEEEKTELINRYEIRVEVARLDRMYKRVHFLNETLYCLKASQSKFEILMCKADERKRLMKMVKGS